MYSYDELGHFGPVIFVNVRGDDPELQYLDVKEINDLCADYGVKIAALLAQHRQFKNAAQGRVIREQIYAHWQVFMIISDKARQMNERYLKQIKRASSPTRRRALRRAVNPYCAPLE